ncbi:four helix bundle protein [Candidatus Woesearchaeota archaeon]|nr:four helix bundle protein [Candidatus Woesearchaeota archaeon]
MPRNYQELEIFHLSYNFVVKLYPFLNQFPESEHKNLVLQMKRSAISIPMNIAEGSSRRTNREFLTFLTYSLGSGKELEVSLRLSRDLSFLRSEEYITLNEDLAKVMAKLASMIKYYETTIPPKKEVLIGKMERGELFTNSLKPSFNHPNH